MRSSRFFSKMVLLLIVVFISSCGEKFPGYEKLAEFCNKDAGYDLGAPSYVDGFYVDTPNCYNCWLSNIIDHSFKYTEIRVENPSPWVPYTESGIWRIERQKIGHASCDAILQKKLEKKRGSSPYTEFMDKYCFSVTKIKEPISQFGSFSSVEEIMVIDNKYSSEIIRIEHRVVDIVSDVNQSYTIKYTLYPYPLDPLHYGYNLGCHDLEKNDFDVKRKYITGTTTLLKLRKKETKND
ncbi:MAG: hypothetical protein ACI9Y1_002033 [Lentisphaeria bacterium]|jgi:hypothetical protein